MKTLVRLMTILAMVAVFGWMTAAQAQVVVATSVIDYQNPATPMDAGTTFTMQVEVLSNDTPTSIPVAVAFRVNYSSDTVTISGWNGQNVDGWLGAIPAIGPVEGTPANTFTDIATIGNFANTDPTPICYTVDFLLSASYAHTPFTICIEDDPAGNPIFDQTTTEIPHTFNCSGTTNLTAVGEWMHLEP